MKKGASLYWIIFVQMAVEIEAKIKLNEGDLERISKLLDVSDPITQGNIIYDLENGFLRIRYEDGKTFCTFKGEKNDSEYNSREEIEFCIDSIEHGKLESFFRNLGFKDAFVYSKMRKYAHLNDCTICIDYLLNGDRYIEVEGAEEDIEKNLDFLGLSDREIETRSYQEILK